MVVSVGRAIADGDEQPFEYLGSSLIPKEKYDCDIQERDGLTEGAVGINGCEHLARQLDHEGLDTNSVAIAWCGSTISRGLSSRSINQATASGIVC